jgi:hypothetical protein
LVFLAKFQTRLNQEMARFIGISFLKEIANKMIYVFDIFFLFCSLGDAGNFKIINQ